MKQPVRILQVVNMNQNSGVSSFVINIFKKINLEKIHFDFITWDIDEKNNYINEVREKGAEVFVLPHYKENFVLFNRKIKKILSENHYDGIHCHEYLVSLIFLYWAKQKGINMRIAHSHNPTIESSIKRKMTVLCRGLFHYYATNFMACSDESGEFLFGKDVKAVVIENGIDIEQFHYSEERRKKIRNEFSIDEQLVVGNIGRLTFQKNQNFLLEVFSKILKEESNAVLMIVGDGELKDELQARTRELQIEKRVLFLGVRRDIPDLLCGMDVFCFPSSYEGLGIAAIEAQCSGLPVLASNKVPIDTQITDLIEYLSTDDVSLWADCIKKIKWKNQQKRENYWKEVKKSGFDIMESAEQLKQFYYQNVKG